MLTKSDHPDLFEILSQQPVVPYSPKIGENINIIVSICDHFYFDQQYYGHASLNRKILLDKEIADHLTPEVIGYLFTNPDDKTRLYRNHLDDKPIYLKDCIKCAINEGLILIKSLPNNDINYGVEAHEKQKKNFEENTLRIFNHIKEAALIEGPCSAEISFEETLLLDQFNQITKTVDLISLQNQLDALLGTMTLSSTQEQILFGLSVICKKLQVLSEVEDKTVCIFDELVPFCQQFLNTPEVILNPEISHLFYDRGHLLIGLISEIKLSMADKCVSLRDMFKKFVQLLDQYPTNTAIDAKEQFALRLFLISQDLKQRFPLQWMQAKQVTSGDAIQNEVEKLLQFGQFKLQEKPSSPVIFNFNQEQAEAYLKNVNQSGVWLLRQSGTHPGLITLSTLFSATNKVVRHIRFGLTDKGWQKAPLVELEQFTRNANQLAENKEFVEAQHDKLLPVVCNLFIHGSDGQQWRCCLPRYLQQLPSKDVVACNDYHVTVNI